MSQCPDVPGQSETPPEWEQERRALIAEVATLTTELAAARAFRSRRRAAWPLLAAVIAGLVTIVPTVQAADDAGRYITLAYGSNTCGSYVKDFDADNLTNTKNQSWILGYLSAVNYYKADTYDIKGSTNAEKIFQWVYDYAKRNPLSDLDDATRELVETLDASRVVEAPDKD